MADLALRRTSCEYEVSAQNALVSLMSFSVGGSAPGLKSRLEAFVKNASHQSCLNDLTLYLLNSSHITLFCDFFYALCQLGYAAPPESHHDVALTLRRAITIARRNTLIRQVALCYFQLLGTEKCINVVADSLLSAHCSSESNAVAIALASLHCDERPLLSTPTNHAIAQPTFMFPVDFVAFLKALPIFFHSLPSAALRSLCLQIVHQGDTTIAPLVLRCMFSLPHFFLTGFLFKLWLQIVQKMRCPATLLQLQR